MLSVLVAIAVTQLPPARVVVVDVSAPDAVYEDVSRAIAEQVVAELRAAGLEAVRIDENELPEEGCRLGPCLGTVARARQAKVVVIVDAVELDKKGRTQVSVAAMAGRDGMPINARRYVTRAEARPAAELKALIKDLARRLTPPDAGT
ncbi:MAG: hypothetical protein H6Q89_5162 [Myxococcaceae bacterium]|nr:hypothetical protein [Myxococcaceae bacterium]